MINEVEHPFMCLLAICIYSLEKCLFRTLPIFGLGCLLFWYWPAWAAYKFWRLILCQLLHLQIISPILTPGSLVGLMVDSGRAHAQEYFPELLLPVSLSLQWATVMPCLCRRPSNTSSRVADRVLVLQPGVRPAPLRWDSWVQNIGPPKTSRSHVISNGESSPRDLHLNAKSQLHSTTSKLQCWTPHAKQIARKEHNLTH